MNINAASKPLHTAPINLRRTALSWTPKPVRFLIWDAEEQKMILNNNWWSSKAPRRKKIYYGLIATSPKFAPGQYQSVYGPQVSSNRYIELGLPTNGRDGRARSGMTVMNQASGRSEDW